MMNQFANMLKSHGVTKGDRVAIYMPASPMAVVGMLACARIGAIHSIVFAGFSSEALSSRINDGIDLCWVLIKTVVFSTLFSILQPSVQYC
jgi:acetyl-CoA synthetase